MNRRSKRAALLRLRDAAEILICGCSEYVILHRGDPQYSHEIETYQERAHAYQVILGRINQELDVAA